METETQRGTEMDGQNACVLICTLSDITLSSIFQPAAAKLNSAFLLSVNDIGDHGQLGFVGCLVSEDLH